MRLLIFSSFIGICILISFARPFLGLLVFSWLAYMRPQNFVWESIDYRFSYLIAIALLLGCLLNSNKEKIWIRARENYLMITLWLVTGVSTFFSIWQSQSFPKFIEFSKIIFISIIITGLVNSKKRFKNLSLVTLLSLTFYAVKGAIASILTGYRLDGPAGGMMADNNEFAMGLCMLLPFLVYLGKNETKRLYKNFFYLQIPFVILAIIYTYSRGGFIGLAATVLALTIKSRKKFIGIIILVIAATLFFMYTPQAYKERITTITTYELDDSAMGRIYAWQAAWGMALDHPLTGVGFRNFLMMFPQYHWFTPRVAHNSYLQLLAECGFIALGLFLLLLFSSIWKLRTTRKKYPFTPKTAWIHNYSHMLEVGFIAYMVCGMFLSRADFDLIYQFVGMTVALEYIANKETLIPKNAK